MKHTLASDNLAVLVGGVLLLVLGRDSNVSSDALVLDV